MLGVKRCVENTLMDLRSAGVRFTRKLRLKAGSPARAQRQTRSGGDEENSAPKGNAAANSNRKRWVPQSCIRTACAL